MTWRLHGAREQRRAKRFGGDAGSTPAVRSVAPAGVAQMAAPTVQRQRLGERPHSPMYPVPSEVVYTYPDMPYAPLVMQVRYLRTAQGPQPLEVK